MESEVKSSASFAKSIADLMPDSDAKKSIMTQIEQATKDPNLSLRQKFDMANNFKQLLGGMLGQHYKISQIEAETKPRIEAAQKERDIAARASEFASQISGGMDSYIKQFIEGQLNVPRQMGGGIVPNN
jgi:hypothetical protein